MSTNHYLSNMIRTPDGTILQSFHRHDYREYVDKNGLTYMVDGGLDYLRRISHKPETMYEELSVTPDDDHDIIRKSFHWGTRGKDGKSPLKWTPLEKLTSDHIEAILETQTHISQVLKNVFQKELDLRAEFWRNHCLG